MSDGTRSSERSCVDSQLWQLSFSLLPDYLLSSVITFVREPGTAFTFFRRCRYPIRLGQIITTQEWLTNRRKTLITVAIINSSINCSNYLRRIRLLPPHAVFVAIVVSVVDSNCRYSSRGYNYCKLLGKVIAPFALYSAVLICFTVILNTVRNDSYRCSCS